MTNSSRDADFDKPTSLSEHHLISCGFVKKKVSDFLSASAGSRIK